LSDPGAPGDPRDPRPADGGSERDPQPAAASAGSPDGGSAEERPPALIPSRAARHQPRRRLFSGRSAKPPGPQPPSPPPSDPKPAARRIPWPSIRRLTAGQAGGPGPGPGRGPGPGPKDAGLAEPAGRPSARSPRGMPARLGELAGSSLGLAGTLVVLAAVLVLAADALPVAKAPATPATSDPYSARWVCPLLPGQPASVTVANVGGATATLRTTVPAGGRPSRAATATLAAGASRELQLRPRQAGYVQVEAFSAPVVASAPGLGCAAGPGSRWWLPASDTRLGTDTKVVIANPDNQPAVVDLVPHLTSGSIRPEEEVFVKPGQTVVKSLGDDAPAGLKPSIEVVAKAGRVVAGAAVTARGSKQPTLLPAQGAVRPAWSFAGGVSGGGRRSQLLVTNPNPAPLQLRVQVTTTRSTLKPAGRFEEPIANGGTAELDIPPLGVDGPFAVQVRSADGAPFVAALRVSEGDNTTSRIDLGAAQPERGWLVPGVPGTGRLVLANLSSAPLEARLADLGGPGGFGRPVRVPPGRVAVQDVPKGAENLLLATPEAGLVAAPFGGGPIVPRSAVGGLPPGGPIVPGPAAAP
jgi:hypothetical protein